MRDTTILLIVLGVVTLGHILLRFLPSASSEGSYPSGTGSGDSSDCSSGGDSGGDSCGGGSD